jgi:3-oxo-5-alpha-steroid 4-dehydrogenase 1
MGKTSSPSVLNIPGRLAWLTMESPGFLTLLYLMRTLPLRHGITDLPWQNRVLAGLFVIHYSYRAVMYPFLQPSIAPLHVAVWALAAFFQLTNAVSLGGWLAAYGTVTEEGWRDSCSVPQFVAGITVFYLGLAANFFHDEELREIRRRENRRQERIRREQGHNGSASTNNNKGPNVAVSKHYQIPQAGLFKYMLFPHYFCEWVEWFGYWMAAGWGCTPARTFLVNELFTMVPRAVRGKQWYVEKFGEEKVGKKWAAIPGVW